MATIRNDARLMKKLQAFARGNDITPLMMLAAQRTRTEYIAQVQNITGSRRQVRSNPTRTVTVSDPGTAPNNDQGYLVAGTDVFEIRRNAVEVASTAEYAAWLELGTRKMRPRPALGPAYDKTLKLVIADIAKGIARQIRRITNG